MNSGLSLRVTKDIIFKSLVASLSFILMIPLLFIIYYITSKGLSAFSIEFFTQLPKPVGEVGGGVSNAIVGSLLLVCVACALSIPLGIFTGIFLAENPKNKIAEYTKLSIDTLQGIPSIVMGVIAYAWIVVPMGSFSAFSGGIALGLMMLPLIAKSTEETIKMLPYSLKEAAYALGASYPTVIIKVILPAAKNGIFSGIILGIARITGETAPLLFTAFGNPFMSTNIFKSVNALPLLIFNYATSPYQDWQTLAWGASLLLILFVLTLSLIAKLIK